MGKIFYLIGPSASGKDRLLGELKTHFQGRLRTMVMYTTRPIRSGEVPDESYHFITAEELEAQRAAGNVIESRTYQTVYGPWTYATLDDGAIDLEASSYLMAGTLESYAQTLAYYGEAHVVPLYIEVEPGLRLSRALARERAQAVPKYAEMCRRFLADEEDFSEEKQAQFRFPRKYVNDDFARCLDELSAAIERELP